MKVRVVPQVRAETAIELSMLAGVLIGALNCMLYGTFEQALASTFGYGYFLVQLIMFLLPIAPFGAVIIRYVVRRSTVVWCIVLFCFMYSLTFAMVGFVRSGGVEELALVGLPLILLGTTLMALPTSVFGLIPILVIRRFVSVVDDDGTWCRQCAYPIGRSESATCPECGMAKGNWPAYPCQVRRLIYWSRRWVRPITLAAAVSCLGAYAYYEFSAAYPIRLFLKQFNWGSNTDRMLGLMVNWNSTSSTDSAWFAVARSFPLESDPNKIIAVCFSPRPREGQPPMQIALQWAYTPATGMPTGLGGWTSGSPPILCNLNDDQARFVIEHGVPKAIIHALLQEAERQGWPAANPFTATQSPMSWYVHKEVVVVPVSDLLRNGD